MLPLELLVKIFRYCLVESNTFLAYKHLFKLRNTCSLFFDITEEWDLFPWIYSVKFCVRSLRQPKLIIFQPYAKCDCFTDLYYCLCDNSLFFEYDMIKGEENRWYVDTFNSQDYIIHQIKLPFESAHKPLATN